MKVSETNAGRASVQYTFTNDARVLRIEAFPDLDRETAEVLLKEGRMGLEALYANALSPYPGDISNRLVAQEKFRPQFFHRNAHANEYQYFLLFANERLGYGVTADDSIKYRSLLGWLYCEQDRCFYKVRYFVPPTAADLELEQLFLSFVCP